MESFEPNSMKKFANQLTSASPDKFINAASNIVNESVLNFHEKNLNIIHVNSQGLLDSSHFNELQLHVARQKNIDVILISESWLRKSIPNKAVSLPNFKIYRCDRPKRKGDKDRGGGVVVYVANQYKSKIIASLIGSNKNNKPAFEILLVEVITKLSKIVIGCLYRLTHCDVDADNTISDFVSDKTIKYDNIFIAGDFNMNILNKECQNKLLSIFPTLLPINKISPSHYSPNSNPSLLDLMLVNNLSKVKSYGSCCSNISHHHLIFCSLFIKPKPPEMIKYSFHNFNKIDPDKLYQKASLIDWNKLLNIDNINHQAESLNDILLNLFIKTVPVSSGISKHPSVPWFSAEIKQAIIERNSFYKFWKSNTIHTHSKLFYSWYKTQFNLVKSLIKKSKKRQFCDKYNACKNNSEKWKLISDFGITKNLKSSVIYLILI